MTASLRERITSAIALHRGGQLEEAEKVYVEVLEADPSNVTALHFLGVLRCQQGHALQGIDLVKLAIDMQPDYVDAINNLGNIQLRGGATIEAAAAYKRALELRPDHPEALRNLGLALRKLRRHSEAAGMLERAIEHWPEKVENYYSLANAYKDMGRPDEAVQTMRKALAIKPEGDGYRRLGQLLYALRRTDEAVANYEAWLRAEPDNPVPRHMLAAWTLKDVPARAGDAFVVNVFDGFAESFDEVLMGRLEYRAPALVGEALKRVEGEPRAALDIVDAGCGTGLLAQHLRPYARHLVGVDLSPKMLQKARARGYDRLVAAELAAFLSAAPAAFDLVASSDTLVYFGDLGEVLAAARRALRSGGRLVFTLEHTFNEQDAPEGYCIQPHGRYAHTQSYAREALADAGFDVVEIVEVQLRREGQSYVDGLLVSARATGAASPPRPRRSARTQPQASENDPQALHDFAVRRYREGGSLAALDLLRRAIALEPAHVDAYVSLGHIQRQLGSVANAAQAYRKALELRPDHAEAAQNLAPVLEELARLERTAAAHRRALEQDPADVDRLLALALAYERMDRAEEESATLREVLAIRPEPGAYGRLGTLLRAMGRLDEAAALYQDWLRADPDSAVARHMLAACAGKDVGGRAADAFVTREFDEFADTFDEVLRKLEYRAPALVARALLRMAGEPRGDLEVLDAGCGTGLLAPHLRPYARRLVGVDLSPKMLEKAANRAVYDELVAAELTSYLGASPRAFDIVASSDTLVYFGDLRAVLAAASASLRPGGRLAFTLERANEDEVPAGYRINPDGRYMHTQQYVRGVLEQAGFESIDIEKGTLRREGNAYVEGLVVAARVGRCAGPDTSSSLNP
jgi:predicted TPR repeat methyltransferase